MGLVSGARLYGKGALLFVGLALAGPLVAGCGAGSKPIASVNGQALDEKEFASLCETSTHADSQQGTVGLQVLGRWIGNTIIAQEAKKNGIYPSQAELDARVAAIRHQVDYTGGNLEQALSRQGNTMDAFKRDVLNDLTLEKIRTRGVSVTDAEIRDEFEKEKPQLTLPETVEISQITTSSKQKIDQARNDLNSNTQFEAAAASYSEDPFRDSGGRVPRALTSQMPSGGPVDPKVVQQAFKLKPGQVSDPIHVGANWVIVRLEKKTDKKVPNLPDWTEHIRARLLMQKAETTGKAQSNIQQFASAAQSAKIEVNPPQFQIVKQLIAQQGPPILGTVPSGVRPAPAQPAPNTPSGSQRGAIRVPPVSGGASAPPAPGGKANMPPPPPPP